MGKSLNDCIEEMSISELGCWHHPTLTTLRVNGIPVSLVRLIYERYIGQWPEYRAEIGRTCKDNTCISPNHIYHKVLYHRFWEKVKKTSEDGCWLWTGAKDGGGYGILQIATNIREKAHRWSWQTYYKQNIPKGYQVLHHCDNPSCVNPRHLFLGTNQDNVTDKMRKGRFNPCFGNVNGMCKITEEDVKKIVELHNNGYSYRQITKLFPIGNTQIGRIIRKESWKWLWDSE